MNKLTPAERETLLALRNGPRYYYSLPDDARMVIPTLHHERRLLELVGRAEDSIYRLSDAGRAALAGEETTRPADTIDPEAWAALLRVAKIHDKPMGRFTIQWHTDSYWCVTIRAPGDKVGHGDGTDLNGAIRAAVAQAEGREGGDA